MKKIKRFIKRLILNPFIARLCIRWLLRWHSFSYKWSGLMACQLNDGIHPKHGILQYKEWFLSQISPHWTVLDIGSNIGLMPYVFSQKAEFVYGIEIVPEYSCIAESKHANNNIRYFCADATQFDYSHCRPIHCVTLSNVLEHIENRVDFLTALIQKVHWADTEKKLFIIRVPMIDREWIVPYKQQMGVDYRLDPTHHIEYTYEKFEHELKRSGVIIQRSHIRFGEIYAVCQVKND
ncbi:MAG: methyltransferase domain-containing protein [Candidatus Magnetomorum sp.]|nr:methyltransferase domain-containing protein [Candidatus Magnetomorum sp.]